MLFFLLFTVTVTFKLLPVLYLFSLDLNVLIKVFFIQRAPPPFTIKSNKKAPNLTMLSQSALLQWMEDRMSYRVTNDKWMQAVTTKNCFSALKHLHKCGEYG